MMCEYIDMLAVMRIFADFIMGCEKVVSNVTYNRMQLILNLSQAIASKWHSFPLVSF